MTVTTSDLNQDEPTTNRSIFNDARQAVTWFQRHNPAREKYFNLLEPERGSRVIVERYSGDHPDDLYAAVLGAICGALKRTTWPERVAFNLCELGRPERVTNGSRIHPDYVADAMGIRRKALGKLLADIYDDLDRELKRRGLVRL